MASSGTGFQPGGFTALSNFNFISEADIVAKSYEENLVPIYGNQNITTLIENMGNRKEVGNLTHSHWEEVKIMPKVTVTTAGASAGAQATFTITATSPAQILTLSQNSPYVATSPATYKAGLTVKVGDHLILKAGSGPINAATNIQVRIDSVNKTAATFTARPLYLANAIPAMASATELFIAGNSYGEGSDMPEPYAVLPEERFYNLQICKHKYSCTGTEANIITYIGNTSYKIKGEIDGAKVFANKVELTLLTGQLYDNFDITDAEEPISLTKGLFPQIIEDGGYVQGYSTLTHYGIDDYEDLCLNLDKALAPKDHMQQCGLPLSLDIDRSMADFYKNGANVYDSFGGASAQAASLNYDAIQRGNYKFMKSQYTPFTDTQMFGADGYSYPSEGFTIPMKGGNDKKTGEYVNAMSVMYLKDRYQTITPFNGLTQGDNGTDKMEVRYQAHRGLETYGIKNYVYIKKQDV